MKLALVIGAFFSLGDYDGVFGRGAGLVDDYRSFLAYLPMSYLGG